MRGGNKRLESRNDAQCSDRKEPNKPGAWTATAQALGKFGYQGATGPTSEPAEAKEHNDDARLTDEEMAEQRRLEDLVNRSGYPPNPDEFIGEADLE